MNNKRTSTNVPEEPYRKNKGSSVAKAIIAILTFIIFFFLAVAILGSIFGKDSRSSNNGGNTASNGGNNIPVSRVIYNGQGITITYKGLTTRSTGVDLNMLIENNSTKDIYVSVENFSINGFALNETFYAEVPAGKKTNEGIFIWGSTLDDNGLNIGNMRDAEMYFEIKDNHSLRTIAKTNIINFII